MKAEIIKKAARVAGVPLYRIAADIGISEATMTRWLRFDLPDERAERLLAAIKARETAEREGGK